MAEKRKKKRTGKKRGSEDERGATVTDGRFAHIHHDPRFERLPSKKTKVAVDERFAGVFEDKRFSQPKVDKYGRKVKASAAPDSDLRRLYDDSSAAEIEQGNKDDAAATASDSDSDSDDEVSPEMDANLQEEDSDADAAGGSDEEADGGPEDEESGSDSESEAEQPEWAKELENDDEAEAVEMGDAHRRLAVLNCEWERMKATDVLAIVKSFVPPDGSVERVTVYPSEIGMKAMAEEQEHGKLTRRHYLCCHVAPASEARPLTKLTCVPQGLSLTESCRSPLQTMNSLKQTPMWNLIRKYCESTSWGSSSGFLQ